MQNNKLFRLVEKELNSNNYLKLTKAGFKYIGSRRMFVKKLKKLTWAHLYQLPGEVPLYTTKEALVELNTWKKAQVELFN